MKTDDLQYDVVRAAAQLPHGITMRTLATFLHDAMKPYEDRTEDIMHALDYAFSPSPERGGFVVLAISKRRIAGAVVVLRTGWKGYIPENLLLFAAVRPRLRGRGIGRRLIETALQVSEGAMKLHVEYDNPAMELYKRIGFTSKYAEMRYEA